MKTSIAIHHEKEPFPDTSLPDSHQDLFSMTTLGFWAYLMTDCLIFGSLFATYAVLHNSTFHGPASRDLFSLPYAFVETMILLFSSVTCGFAILSSLKNRKSQLLFWLGISLLLGASFIAMELHEFIRLVEEGNSWTRSAFLSAFFSLVGTHGLHVSIGLVWMVALMAQIYWFGVTIFTFRRLIVFSLFWHFLDLVWIFIFTFVYLMGVL